MRAPRIGIRLATTLRCITLFLTVIFSPLVVSDENPAAPVWSSSFEPQTIGPGSTSILRFLINNSGGPVDSLAFANILPPGVTFAAVTGFQNTCGGTLTSDGTASFALSGGTLGAGAACSISVYVTVDLPGEFQNVSGDLTSSGGNSGSVVGSLLVDATLPGFSKAFSPSTVGPGGRSTLSFTIDSSLATPSESGFTRLAFMDPLPDGLVVADPANAVSTCLLTEGPFDTVLGRSPNPGDTSITFSSYVSLAAGATCVISVDVTPLGVGLYENVSGTASLTVGFSPSEDIGIATAGLQVAGAGSDLLLTTSFAPNTMVPGGQPALVFTLLNRNRSQQITQIRFDDDLDSVLSGLSPVDLSVLTSPCGAGSMLSFQNGVLSLDGGVLESGARCDFEVPLAVPVDAKAGAYVNVISQASGDMGGQSVMSPAASGSLFVVAAIPRLSHSFSALSAAPGDTIEISYALSNDSTEVMTGISFGSRLTEGTSANGRGFLPFPANASSPTTTCQDGAPSIVPDGIDAQALIFSGGSLGAGENCEVKLNIVLPTDLGDGVAISETGLVSATVDGVAVTGPASTASILLVGAPRLTMAFNPATLTSQNTATLLYTLRHSGNAPADATGINFTHDLADVFKDENDNPLATITAIDERCEATAVAGVGTSEFSMTGAELPAGGSCEIEVVIQFGQLAGLFTTSSSEVSAEVGGQQVSSGAASASLAFEGFSFQKEYTPSAFYPGQAVSLRYVLTNTDSVDATITYFTNALPAQLASSGVVSSDTCGGSLTGTTALIYVGGELNAGATCEIIVELDTSSAVSGSFSSATSSLAYQNSSGPKIASPATASLLVNRDQISLVQQFSDSELLLGSMTELTYTVLNFLPAESVAQIQFTDPLLPELAPQSLESNGCGGDVSLTPSGLSVSSVTLGGGGSCSFTISIKAETSAASGPYTMTTSSISGMATSGEVTGPPASTSITLVDVLPAISKSIQPTTVFPGGTVTMVLTVSNASSGNPINGIGLIDDLAAVMPGLAAEGLPRTDICGVGSSLEGAEVVVLSNGSLPIAATEGASSCDISVTLRVPDDAVPGNYMNTTSRPSINGSVLGQAASAGFEVLAPPEEPAKPIPALANLVLALLTVLLGLLGMRRLATAK